MSNIVAMGLPGPAPAAVANASPPAGAKGKAGAFARALQTQGAQDPVSENPGIGPPGEDPGSLDIQAVVQALLGGGAAIEGQTETTGTSQLDRLAEVGTVGTDEQETIPVDGLPFVVLMQQPAPQTVAVVDLEGRAGPQTQAAVGQPVAGDAMRPDVLNGELPATASPVATAARTAARGEVAPAVLQAVAEQKALKAQVSEAATPTVETLSEADPVALTEPTLELAAELPDQPKVLVPEAFGDGADLLTEPEAPAAVEAPEVGGLEMAAAQMDGDGASPIDVPDEMLPAMAAMQPMTRDAAVTATNQAATGEVPVSDTFASDLAGTVRRATLVGDNEVRLLLNPPELGHVDVRITDSPNGLRVVMEAANAEARELIEQHLPALRAALEGRDLRIDRIQLERPAASADRDALGNGSRDALGNQSGNPGGFNQEGERGHESAPWSSVAAIRSNGTPEMGEPPAGAESQATEALGSAGHGRLDVLA